MSVHRPRTVTYLSVLVFSSFVTACGIGPTKSQYDEAARAAEPARFARAAPAADDDERSLARETRLDVVVRIARARNPDLAEARERVSSGVERARSLSHWPDPQVSYQLWQQPLARPVSLGDANMHMFSVRQTIPAPGSVDARSRAALEDAKVLGQSRAAREQDVASEARRAFAAYYEADREKVLHLAHVALASELVELTRANYAAGRRTQQDVVRLMVELSKLHTDIATIDQRIASVRARLNALMGRAAEAPLGPPAEIDLAGPTPTVAELEHGLRARRPELVAAANAARRAEAELDGAKSRGRWPELMVGVDYMLMPMGPDRHNYGAMLGMTVPWLNPAHRDEVRASEHALLAEKQSITSIETAIVAQLHDAAARVEAARRTLVVFDRDLLPQARANLESARAGYVTGATDTVGLVDALRSYIDVRLERTRAVARLETSVADIERAGGIVLEKEASR